MLTLGKSKNKIVILQTLGGSKKVIVILLTLGKSKEIMVVLLTLGKSKNIVVLLTMGKSFVFFLSKNNCHIANFGQVNNLFLTLSKKSN